MKNFIAIVVMLCAVLVSSTAAAADWVWVASNKEHTIYVDNNSIRRDYNYPGYVFRAFTKKFIAKQDATEQSNTIVQKATPCLSGFIICHIQ